MISIVLAAVLAASCALALPEGKLHFPPPALSDDLVEYINKAGSTWKASRYERFSKMGESAVRKMMGARLGGNANLPTMVFAEAPDVIPPTFDSRVQWPNCPSLRDIRDQGSCGSCWVSVINNPILHHYKHQN